MEYQGLTALVTGASSGLGEEFAKQLAALGANLILVARSEDKLETLAETLRQTGKNTVYVMPADLGSTEDLHRLILDMQKLALRVDLLINNAGVGIFRNFLDSTLEEQMSQIDLNVSAMVSLTHAFAPAMVAAGGVGIINIASTAAFQPAPGANVYAASKAFVLFFSEALSFELRKSGVCVLAACPGPVATHFFANMQPAFKMRELDQPANIVREILTAFRRKKRVVFPGKLKNFLGTLGARFMPRNIMLWMTAGVIRRFNKQ